METQETSASEQVAKRVRRPNTARFFVSGPSASAVIRVNLKDKSAFQEQIIDWFCEHTGDTHDDYTVTDLTPEDFEGLTAKGE